MFAGMSEADFWEADVDEVNRFLKVYRMRRDADEKRLAGHMYKMADLIGVSIGRYLNEKNKFPPIEQVFPGLFEEEAEEQRNQQNVRNFLKFAAIHNAKVGG